jgi:hypothetical protein
MPVGAVSDLTGDGVAELALVRNLTWQPGARLEIFDVVAGVRVKQIVLEEIDTERKRDERWHPGLLVRETGDLNGDGSRELVVVTLLGEKPEIKEPRLMVVDLRREEVVADFRVLGIDLLDLEASSEFGLVGTGGEVYLLNVANDLRIDVVGADGGSSSPVTVSWTGTASGAFNQVFIDSVEVARTNENEATVTVGRGEHEVTVRSLDEYGRGVYGTVSFTAEKGSTIVVWAFVAAAALLLLAFWFPISTLARRLGFRYVRVRRQADDE